MCTTVKIRVNLFWSWLVLQWNWNEMREQRLRQQRSRWTDSLYEIISRIHTFHTHTHSCAWPLFSLLPPCSFIAKQQTADYWRELWGVNTFHQFKTKQVSFFFVFFLATFLSLSESPFLFSTQVSTLSISPPYFDIFSLLTHSVIFPLPVFSPLRTR